MKKYQSNKSVKDNLNVHTVLVIITKYFLKKELVNDTDPVIIEQAQALSINFFFSNDG
ncbi:Uncharacterised protein [Streptococcus dysgalactiae]|nr:Uncharacterised protein [Streptococcus dysgalactiae subsp. dysgalactiae]SUN52120.1 Uncharacterised protein [Streptococcus dysgalactiae]